MDSAQTNSQNIKPAALGSAVDSMTITGKIVTLLDMQASTVDLLSTLNVKLGPVVEPGPQPSAEFSDYIHINVALDRQEYINDRLRQILTELVI